MDSFRRAHLKKQSKLPFKARALGVVVVAIVRTLGVTMKFELDDPDGVVDWPPKKGMIWALWHNRIFALPLIYKKLIPRVHGVVLTSASRDGNYLAGIARALGVCAARGSSSRRGSRAMVELTQYIRDGFVVGITPDGPRGPRYELASGVIKLSQITRAPIATMQIDYSKYWSISKSWDRFRIPKPFSTIYLTITLNDPVPEDLDEESFQAAREKIQTLLNPRHETD